MIIPRATEKQLNRNSPLPRRYCFLNIETKLVNELRGTLVVFIGNTGVKGGGVEGERTSVETQRGGGRPM